MKKLFLLLLATFAIQDVASAQTPTLSNTTGQNSDYQIVQNDANSRVLERTVYEQRPNGETVTNIHSYTELATGLNHLVNGQWVESREEIDILPNGTAAATNGQHQVYFPGDIYQGVIKLVTPDGLQMQSRPVGLSYDDGSNTVLFAILTNSIGGLASSNQVIYPNVFEGINADLHYTYRKGGFEQDVVLRQQLPSPENYGLNPQTTRLQMLTEFFDTADPAQTITQISQQDGLSDTTLAFGTMKMMRGKAFSIGDTITPTHQNRGTPVYKSWLHVQGRTFLVEELPYRKIEPQTLQLPAAVSGTTTSLVDPVLYKVSALRLLPPIRMAQVSTNSMQLAKADFGQKNGVVLDYDEIDSDQTNFTFQGDTTYYISTDVNFDGITTFEGGTVLKMGGMLSCNGNVVCQTGPYRPAIFTSWDDNSVGQTISGSSGTPSVGGNYLDLNTSVDPLKYLRMLYAGISIMYCADPILEISDSQFLNNASDNCALDFVNDQTLVILNNDLFSQCGCITYNDGSGDGGYVYGNQITADQMTYGGISLTDDGEGCVGYLTNSILTSISGSTGINLYSSELLGSGSGIYQTVGGGSYYLATNSIYRNAGTTNIDPAVLADIATKTTYPPIDYSNVNISTSTTLSVQAQRDNAGNPDLGYHYDPLDYAFGGCSLSTNIQVADDVAIGIYGIYGQAAGILLNNGANFTATGTATAPCWIAFANSVQEGCNGQWVDSQREPAFQFNGSGSGEPQLNTTFTKMFDGAFQNAIITDGSDHGECNFQNSEFWMGGVAAYDEQFLNFSNCFFFRPQLYFWDQDDNPNLTFGNCTFYDGILVYGRQTYFSSSVVTFINNAFDGTAFPWGDNLNSNTNDTKIDYNAFNTNNLSWQSYYYPYGPCNGTLQTIGSHTIYVTNYNWESSWFGNNYLPTNSPLINAGSTTGDQIGLYHFTIQTNQVPETNSTVDIGYHYVATDQYGNPLDSNGDGIPDYLEDANGDGIYDSGDSANWQNTLNIDVIITRPRLGTSLP